MTAHLPCLQVTVASDAYIAQQQAMVKTMRQATQLMINRRTRMPHNVPRQAARSARLVAPVSRPCVRCTSFSDTAAPAAAHVDVAALCNSVASSCCRTSDRRLHFSSQQRGLQLTDPKWHHQLQAHQPPSKSLASSQQYGEDPLEHPAIGVALIEAGNSCP